MCTVPVYVGLPVPEIVQLSCWSWEPVGRSNANPTLPVPSLELERVPSDPPPAVPLVPDVPWLQAPRVAAAANTPMTIVLRMSFIALTSMDWTPAPHQDARDVPAGVSGTISLCGGQNIEGKPRHASR